MAKATLGDLIAELSGKLGDTRIAKNKNGVVIRGRSQYKRASSPLQTAAQARMKVVLAAWDTLTRAEVIAWNLYADTQSYYDADAGVTVTPTGYNEFFALSLKFVQANPGVPVPKLPPASGFSGDTLRVVATGGSGSLTFTASAPNSPNVTTELLVQRLVNERRTPTPSYNSEAFVVFTAQSLSHSLVLPVGWYATATRFVNPHTGQMKGLIVGEVVEVSAAVGLRLTDVAA